ncbi:hypothetical protein CUMW_199000, partial [Citrus unshiu]
MNRPGDWNCRSCQHLNFQRRDSCQRCGDPRSSSDFCGFGGRGGGSSFGFGTGSDVRPGDWYCSAGNCGAHNFASRSSCFKCGAFKDDVAGGGFDCDMPRSRGSSFGGGNRSGWKSDLDAMNITLLVEWSASDAMPPGTLATEFHTDTLQFGYLGFLKVKLMV